MPDFCFGGWTHAEAVWSHKSACFKERYYVPTCARRRDKYMHARGFDATLFLWFHRRVFCSLPYYWLETGKVASEYCLRDKLNLFSSAPSAEEFRNRSRCRRGIGSRSTVRYRRFQST